MKRFKREIPFRAPLGCFGAYLILGAIGVAVWFL